MSLPSRYWREIPQRYRLEAYKCQNCGAVHFPPRLVCSKCQSRKMEKIRLSGRGQIVSFTIIRVPPHQFEDQAPYAVGLAELEEGIKLTAQIVDCPFEELKTGMKVKVEFRKVFQQGESGILCYGYKFVPE
ncbi:Zn-ribbon domain-containing OB-fold protein [bacterium]|nr:Zn-ribbon domain-containing OB-fold protein [bacterium]